MLCGDMVHVVKLGVLYGPLFANCELVTVTFKCERLYMDSSVSHDADACRVWCGIVV
jgi:hypothetical protein